MDGLTRISVDFSQSHLIFPTIIACILLVLGLAILIVHRRAISGAGAHFRAVLDDMDKPRFFGTIGLTLVYFLAMEPVGAIWPNTGLGFLLCSIPYVLATGVLFLHDRSARSVLPVAVTALVGPASVWWLFSELFFLTLP